MFACLAPLPSGLQTKVHVGEADDEPNQQADEDAAQREALSGGDAPRGSHAGPFSILGQPVECHGEAKARALVVMVRW